VSAGPGTEPKWRADGKELFYLAPDRYVMAVPFEPGPQPTSGTPQRLFQAPVSSLINPSYTRNQYVVSDNGQRFLINGPAGTRSLSVVSVVIDWATLVKNNHGS
jgi:hypothetical protein